MRLRTIACAALVALGLVSPLGYLARTQIPQWPGLHYLVSPLPLVFNRSQGIETYARRARLLVTTTSGRTIEFEGPAVVRALEGPFTRRKVFVELLLYWDTWGQAALWLKRAFCLTPSLATELGIEEPIESVTVQTTSELVLGTRPRQLIVGCA